jgi:hypothetical protein
VLRAALRVAPRVEDLPAAEVRVVAAVAAVARAARLAWRH